MQMVKRRIVFGDGNDLSLLWDNALGHLLPQLRENIMIKKFPSQRKFGLYSIKTHKRLGVFPSRIKAEKREQEIQYFKHKGGK